MFLISCLWCAASLADFGAREVPYSLTMLYDYVCLFYAQKQEDYSCFLDTFHSLVYIIDLFSWVSMQKHSVTGRIVWKKLQDLSVAYQFKLHYHTLENSLGSSMFSKFPDQCFRIGKHPFSGQRARPLPNLRSLLHFFNNRELLSQHPMNSMYARSSLSNRPRQSHLSQLLPPTQQSSPLALQPVPPFHISPPFLH